MMEILPDLLPGLMFVVLIVGLFSNLPVAIVLMGITLLFGYLAIETGQMRLAQVALIPNRIFGGVIENPVLVAAPMFVLMGIIMERTKVAEDLLISLQRLLRGVPGGLAIGVVLMGTILAAATGIIGASVVLLTVLALPTMINRGYDPSLAAGTVASAGTLGILIPPSVMLVFMGDLLTLNLAKLFMAAFVPGLLLATSYLIYIILRASMDPSAAPPVPKDEELPLPLYDFSMSLLMPLLIIVAVLGSILGGWATPTEASGVGVGAALILGILRRRLSLSNLHEALDGTLKTVAMLFMIFVGATAFSYVFRQVGGEHFILDTARSLEFGDWGLLAMMLIMVFIMGFFFDWVEIALILLPIFAPVVQLMEFGDHIAKPDVIYWFAILLAVNLQTSFLTPPFGFALFYLKGAAGGRISMIQVYKGVAPFVLLQLATMGLLIWKPALVLALPARLLN